MYHSDINLKLCYTVLSKYNKLIKNLKYAPAYVDMCKYLANLKTILMHHIIP